MTIEPEFRNKDEEVLKLLDDCQELKQALKTISSQLGRIEARVKHAFPSVAATIKERTLKRSHTNAPTLRRDQALAEFDKIVSLAATGAEADAEKLVATKAFPDLQLIASELGVTFPQSKPSFKKLQLAILGKVKESLLLSRHTRRT